MIKLKVGPIYLLKSVTTNVQSPIPKSSDEAQVPICAKPNL